MLVFCDSLNGVYRVSSIGPPSFLHVLSQANGCIWYGKGGDRSLGMAAADTSRATTTREGSCD